MRRFQDFSNRLKQVVLQFRTSWKDALGAGVASGIAWSVSQHILGHPHPIYAAMSALICLAPGLPNHGRQAIYVLIGVTTGVLVGEATLLLPPMPTEVRIALVGFMGLLIASGYAVIPAIIIQAGVSAIMVFAMGAEVAGVTRLLDVILGTGIGLLFSQVLFTPDQIKVLSISVERLFHELANNFIMAADALDRRDTAAAYRALSSCGRTHIALVALIGSIDLVRDNVRWSLRGRISSREVTTLAGRYDQTGIRLYAATLLFCESMLNSLKKQSEQLPEWLPHAVRLTAENCRFMAGESKNSLEFVKPDRSLREETPIAWRNCVNSLELAENTLARFYKSKTRRSRLQTFRKRRIIHAVRAEMEALKKSGKNT